MVKSKKKYEPHFIDMRALLKSRADAEKMIESDNMDIQKIGTVILYAVNKRIKEAEKILAQCTKERKFFFSHADATTLEGK